MLHVQSFSGSSYRAVKWLTALVWFLAAGGAVVWALKFPVLKDGMSVPVVQETTAQLSADVSRSLGHRATSPNAAVAADMRFQLLGVIAGRSGGGSALISVGGLPPKAFRVGQAVTDGVVLQRLQARRVELGASSGGSALWTLELPAAAKGG